MDRTRQTSAEAGLRDELARADRMLSGVTPVITHMLESAGEALVNDAIVARLRGMLEHLAVQVLAAIDPDQGYERPAQELIDHLADLLSRNSSVLEHLHALAMEAHLANRLERRAGLDPVLSPLMQELIASDNSVTAARAMQALAAQARFVEAQRRMQLPIGELPPELFDTVLAVIADAYGLSGTDQDLQADGLDALRREYDEDTTRLGLLTRLTGIMGRAAVATLEINHAGLALFATGLASLTRQPRGAMVLACHERQAARLALGLRAAGQCREAIERQFVQLEVSSSHGAWIAEISPGRALDLLLARPDAGTLPGPRAPFVPDNNAPSWARTSG